MLGGEGDIAAAITPEKEYVIERKCFIEKGGAGKKFIFQERQVVEKNITKDSKYYGEGPLVLPSLIVGLIPLMAMSSYQTFYNPELSLANTMLQVGSILLGSVFALPAAYYLGKNIKFSKDLGLFKKSNFVDFYHKQKAMIKSVTEEGIQKITSAGKELSYFELSKFFFQRVTIFKLGRSALLARLGQCAVSYAFPGSKFVPMTLNILSNSFMALGLGVHIHSVSTYQDPIQSVDKKNMKAIQELVSEGKEDNNKKRVAKDTIRDDEHPSSLQKKSFAIETKEV